MDAVEIIPPTEPINATVRPPGSKSITNRVLPIAAVAKGTSTLTGVLKSDDTLYMIAALKQLGVEIDDSRLSDIPEESVVVVHGCDGRFPATEADLFLGNSGTSIRFLTAMVAACGRGKFRLDGNERMRQRPIGDLVKAVRLLGATVQYEIEDGFPPVLITSKGFDSRSVRVKGSTSSQFVSAIVMALSTTRDQAAFVKAEDAFVSASYLWMTCDCIDAFGVHADIDEIRFGTCAPEIIRLYTHESHLKGVNFAIEPDASAASYWFASDALGTPLRIEGLSSRSIQGDAKFASVVETANAGGTFDFSDISDTAQTMAAVAVYADSPTTVTGVEHMRHKECDRVSAVVTELRKLGIQCDEHRDGYTIYPGTPVCNEPIETYDDHRMAMSFALLGLKTPGIVIKDPDCVNKTYPRFWDDWAKVTGKPVRRFTL